jgi:hypothetical protein
MRKMSGRTMVYQPLSAASIRRFWENQKKMAGFQANGYFLRVKIGL